jgi:hypothetical protein
VIRLLVTFVVVYSGMVAAAAIFLGWTAASYTGIVLVALLGLRGQWAELRRTNWREFWAWFVHPFDYRYEDWPHPEEETRRRFVNGAGGIWVDLDGADVESFVCGRCWMQSFHPRDVQFGWCGSCKTLDVLELGQGERGGLCLPRGVLFSGLTEAEQNRLEER